MDLLRFAIVFRIELLQKRYCWLTDIVIVNEDPCFEDPSVFGIQILKVDDDLFFHL